jgi:hypothetical protein
LIPDNLRTLKFILGAIDDLLEYYSCYQNMNLIPTMAGLKIDGQTKGWFQENYIHFKYRLFNRKFTVPWLIGIARSVILIEKIKNHDWLRRRAGELEPFKRARLKKIVKLFFSLICHKEKFYTIQTPDFTCDSRALLRDMITTSLENRLDISLGNKINFIENHGTKKLIKGFKENFIAEKVAVCAGSDIQDFTEVKSSTSYAPIAVVSGLNAHSKSFVELDYYPKNCINLVTKKNGFGLAGGISFKQKEKCDTYLDYVVNQHKKYEPTLKEETRYIGVKTEITFKNEPRSYIYHIVQTDQNVWSIIPGKFTLGFSLAPEFFRKIYNKNPRKTYKTFVAKEENNNLIANTVWLDSLNRII